MMRAVYNDELKSEGTMRFNYFRAFRGQNQIEEMMK